MTDEEKEIMAKIVEAHNLYIKLPFQHPDDIPEWVSKIHDLQRIIMSRVAVRSEPILFKHEST